MMPRMASAISVAAMYSRSAAGSSTCPSRLSWWKARAIFPSSKSEAADSASRTTAQPLACRPSTSHRNTGMPASRARLSTLGTVHSRSGRAAAPGGASGPGGRGGPPVCCAASRALLPASTVRAPSLAVHTPAADPTWAGWRPAGPGSAGTAARQPGGLGGEVVALPDVGGPGGRGTELGLGRVLVARQFQQVGPDRVETMVLTELAGHPVEDVQAGLRAPGHGRGHGPVQRHHRIAGQPLQRLVQGQDLGPVGTGVAGRLVVHGGDGRLQL